jgi:hypothetical protein
MRPPRGRTCAAPDQAACGLVVGIAITMYFYDHEPPISMPSTPSTTR